MQKVMTIVKWDWETITLWKGELKSHQGLPKRGTTWGQQSLEKDKWSVKREKVKGRGEATWHCRSLWKVKIMKDHVNRFVIIVERKTIVLFMRLWELRLVNPFSNWRWWIRVLVGYVILGMIDCNIRFVVVIG